MVSCAELRAELSNLVDGDLPPDVRRQIEHHLRECRICQVLYDSMSKTVLIVTETGSFELPEGVATRLRGRIMDELRARGSKGEGREE